MMRTLHFTCGTEPADGGKSAATTRREAEALQRLRALLLAGSPFDAAVWDATGHGRDLDTARLVELYRQHRPAGDDAQGGAA